MNSKITNNPLSDVLKQYNLSLDIFIKLQSNTNGFNYTECKQKIDNLKNSFPAIQTYLYFFVKFPPKPRQGSRKDFFDVIYIGKSINQGNFQRIYYHLRNLKNLQNLKNISKNISNPKSNYRFYQRFYEEFFMKNINSALYLGVINWDNLKELKNIFPFPINVNVSNAEALLIGIISNLYVANVSTVDTKSILNHEFNSRIKWYSMEKNLMSAPKDIVLTINGKSVDDLWNNWCENWFLRKELTISELKNNRGNHNNNHNSNHNSNHNNNHNSNHNNIINIEHIPLFETIDRSNEVKVIKNSKGQNIFKISKEMENNIIECAKEAENSYYTYIDQNTLMRNLDVYGKSYFSDGLLYMVYILKKDIPPKEIKIYEQDASKDINELPEYIPIYIGKTEILGRNGGFSRNLKDVSRGLNKQFFARWGIGKARHIGGLSLMFFNIENQYKTTDHEHWIKYMFDANARSKEKAILKLPVYFKMKPWYPYNISIGKIRNLFTPEVEALLISIGAAIFNDILANKRER